jgi:hypothetical protein
MMTVEDLFIRDGYVLRFSQGQTAFNDRTFAQFFREEPSINIEDPKWSEEGASKGKRLRDFLRIVEVPRIWVIPSNDQILRLRTRKTSNM